MKNNLNINMLEVGNKKAKSNIKLIIMFNLITNKLLITKLKIYYLKKIY